MPRESTKKRGKAQHTNGMSYSDYICNHIREAIVAGELCPGDRLREAEISSVLNVSRTPIREAMKTLQAEGLIVTESWKGVVIRELGRREIVDLYDVRVLVEGLAVVQATERATAEDIDALEAIQMKAESTRNHNNSHLVKLNAEFHQTICVAARNPFLTRALGSLRASLALMRGNAYGEKGQWDKVLSEHRQILDSICNREAERAKKKIEKHIRSAATARILTLAEMEVGFGMSDSGTFTELPTG